MKPRSPRTRIPSPIGIALSAACCLSLAQAAAPGARLDSAGLPVLSLDSVLAKVVAQNPELRMWELRAQGRAEAARGAGAWMAPEIGIGGADLPYGSSSGMAPGDPALMISARQMIPGPGKRDARRRHLESLAEKDRAEGRWMRAAMLADAKAQYARLAVSGRKRAVIREAEEVMRLMLEVAEIRFKLRRADMATVFEARARLQELGNMATMEEAVGRQALSALGALMAEPAQPPFAADTAMRPAPPPDRPDTSRLGQRGDLAALDGEIKSMELELESMRRQGRPDFGIQFDHMEMGSMGRRYSAMAMMTFPFAPWSSGMARSDVAAMRKGIGSMQADRQSRRLMAGRMAEEMRLMLASEIGQSGRLEREVVPVYRMSLDAATASYQEGNGDLFRVLDTWDRWVMARMRFLGHLEKALVLEAEYERETGTL